MIFVVQMLAHTPLYVFVLLAYLVWQGVLSLRTRRQSVWRMLIVPVVFIASGLLLLEPRASSKLRRRASVGVIKPRFWMKKTRF